MMKPNVVVNWNTRYTRILLVVAVHTAALPLTEASSSISTLFFTYGNISSFFYGILIYFSQIREHNPVIYWIAWYSIVRTRIRRERGEALLSVATMRHILSSMVKLDA
jgi:hypothetical protein